jgi:hypothetical protein
MRWSELCNHSRKRNQKIKKAGFLFYEWESTLCHKHYGEDHFYHRDGHGGRKNRIDINVAALSAAERLRRAGDETILLRVEGGCAFAGEISERFIDAGGD